MLKNWNWFGPTVDIALENFAQAVMVICGASVEVVKRVKDGFEVLPRRWVVERTFGAAWTLSPIEQGLWTATRGEWVYGLRCYGAADAKDDWLLDFYFINQLWDKHFR